MPPRGESMPPSAPAGLGASRWATPAPASVPGPPRAIAPAAKPAVKPGGGLGASKLATTPADGTNLPYAGPPDPHHRDPAAVPLETSGGKFQAGSGPGTYQTWHHVEEAGSKIIFHLDEIKCLVRGVVKNKDGHVQDTASEATASLSIVLDKVMVFGKNQEFVVTDQGCALDDGSVLRFTAEGDGHPSRGPALGIKIEKAKNEKPIKMLKSGTPKPIVQRLFTPTPTDIVIDLSSLELEPEDSRLPEAVQKLAAKATAKANAQVAVEQRAKAAAAEQAAKAAAEQAAKANLQLAIDTSVQSPTVPAVVGSSGDSGKKEKALILDSTKLTVLGGALTSRSVAISGLPYGFKVKQVLDFINPTKNTQVIEIKMTKSYSALLGFLTPAGAQDFVSQYKSGVVTFVYQDDDLGMVEWRSKIVLWGDYVPIKPESVPGFVAKGATRYLTVRGRNPITIREANQTWTLDQYRHCLGSQIYDGRIYRDDQDYEVAELEFLSIARAISAIHAFKPKDGFGRATFKFLPDK
ncbi:hypothetical protein TWF281_009193 [Arthrobotrys megalospora]